VVGASNYVGQTLVTWKMVGVSKQTDSFIPQTTVSELDGCPRFAPAYLGRKWFFRMLLLDGQLNLVLQKF
jgi:hypothetical protein